MKDTPKSQLSIWRKSEEAQAEGAKDKKSLKKITLITNLPLFVGTGSTKGGENSEFLLFST